MFPAPAAEVRVAAVLTHPSPSLAHLRWGDPALIAEQALLSASVHPGTNCAATSLLDGGFQDVTYGILQSPCRT